MMSTAIAILEASPYPNHRVNIGARANTGTAWENTKTGSKKRRASGDTIS